MLNYGAYEHWIQSRLVQAQYWHDPLVSNITYSLLLSHSIYETIHWNFCDDLKQINSFTFQDEDTYRKYSLFLSDINNAKGAKNET